MPKINHVRNMQRPRQEKELGAALARYLELLDRKIAPVPAKFAARYGKRASAVLRMIREALTVRRRLALQGRKAPKEIEPKAEGEREATKAEQHPGDAESEAGSARDEARF